jgi:CRP/FNR family transcriptional regulator
MSNSTRAPSRPLSATELKVACSSCGLRELCLPVGFSDEEMTRLDGLVARRTPVPKGASLYSTGDRFEALYAVRTGFFKTRTSSESGREHVTGFQMTGELLGLDGVSSDHHTCDAVALEDSQVCVISYERLAALSREFTELQRQFHRVMGREIVRDHGVMMLLGSMRAEVRLAAFLLNLANRLHARGFSSTSLLLRMTREEIGTYLGLKLETVSRCFSKFHDEGILSVRHREIQILKPAVLEAMVSEASL